MPERVAPSDADYELHEAANIVQNDVSQKGGQTEYAAFAVHEAVLDGKNTYIVVDIKPTSPEYLLLGADASLFDPIGNMGPLFSSKTGTIADYARENNKEMINTSVAIAGVNCSVDYLLEDSGTLVSLIFKIPILNIFGANNAAINYASDYITIILYGTVFQGIGMGLINIIRAEGNPFKAMIIVVVGTIINIILDPIFIFTFDMGISGAAWATIISQIVSSILIISHFIRKKSTLKIKRKN